MLFTASIGSVFISLPLAHTELIVHIYGYMSFTDYKSVSSTYILDFYGMPPLTFLGHTN